MSTTSLRAGEAAAPSVQKQKYDMRRLRLILLIVVPVIAIVVGLYFYLTGGRYQSTENAYAKADMVTISPDVPGRIVKVMVTQNQMVKASDPLFVIDPDPYRIAVERDQAMLDKARSGVEAMKAQYRSAVAQLGLAQNNVDFYQHEYERQTALVKREFASAQAVDAARHNLDVSVRLVDVLKESIAQIVANLGGDPNAPVEKDTSYLTALAALDNARLNLGRTMVRAPFDGIVGDKPQPGDYVAPGTPVVSIISTQNVWIEANFKETQLTHVVPGQDVEVVVDTYPDHTWRGHVGSIAQGTGAEFSLLPPQNATGNWVKVVQRIPVRIDLDIKEDDPIIRAGMSASVEIDTGSGKSSH